MGASTTTSSIQMFNSLEAFWKINQNSTSRLSAKITILVQDDGIEKKKKEINV